MKREPFDGGVPQLLAAFLFNFSLFSFQFPTLAHTKHNRYRGNDQQTHRGPSPSLWLHHDERARTHKQREPQHTHHAPHHRMCCVQVILAKRGEKFSCIHTQHTAAAHVYFSPIGVFFSSGTEAIFHSLCSTESGNFPGQYTAAGRCWYWESIPRTDSRRNLFIFFSLAPVSASDLCCALDS